MSNSYQRRAGRWLLLALLLLAGTLRGRAQSGPYGNEWIVPGQPYYKLKVWRDGLYRLNSAYLSALGAGAVAPSQLQLWRRGKEVAVYQGGNGSTLDASTFLEFYGQRNDGALDRDYYKNPLDQANPYYSFFTDTATYFITWGSRPGKRMAQPAAAGGTPHAWRLQSRLQLLTGYYFDAPFITYLPWLEPGEGFGSIDNPGAGNVYGPLVAVTDTAMRAVATTATTAPRTDITVMTATDPPGGHNLTVSVTPPGSPARQLGQVHIDGYNYRHLRYPLQFGDINSAGLVTFSVTGAQSGGLASYFRYAYIRLTVPQQIVWFNDRASVFFQNDSLLAGPATYEVPGVPATVAGFDIQDPWAVQRIAPAAAGAGAARFVFPSATEAQTRYLLLADESRPLTPPPARRVNFRTISPAASNFVIITHPSLQKAAPGGVANAALEYARYRASAAGGRYDTLMVTAPLLYDQFHYGERSVLALRHFALWLGDNSPAAQAKYLLLLGKGITSGSNVGRGDFAQSYRGVFTVSTTRYQGEIGQDLVPTTSRSASDIFFSSDWPHGNYVPRFATGRVVAATPGQVMDYLNKLKEYESKLDPAQPNPEPWHKEVLNLVGGQSQAEFDRFGRIMEHYADQLRKPLLGANVTTSRRTTEGGAQVQLNISGQLNAGLQLLNYFGHGSPNYLDIDLGDINDPLNGYANAGKYPVMMFNGCAVGACFFVGRTIGSDWILAPNKGAVGLLSESGFSYTNYLYPQQDKLNSLLFNDPAWFGQPVAAVQREAIGRLQHTSDFPDSGQEGREAAEQLSCTVWHGDPALRLFAPAKPDLVTGNGSLTLGPVAGQTTVTATSPQFVLTVGVSNPARITTDRVEVKVTRSYGAPAKTVEYFFDGGTGVNHFPALRQAWRRDTTYALTLPLVADATGDNTFKVELDYRNKIDELSEANNLAQLSYSFLSSGFTLLTPREFAIVNTATPRLVAQSNNPNEAPRSYDVQVDSTASFATGIKTTVAARGSLVSFTPSAPLTAAGRDSVVWYWRVRFSAPQAGENTAWATGSFRVIVGAPAGRWSQSHHGQFNRDELSGLVVAAPTNRWSFVPRPMPVRLRTVGGGVQGTPNGTFVAAGGTIATDLGSPPTIESCGKYTLNILVAVLSPTTGRRVAVPGGPYTDNICGQGSQTFYNFGRSPAGKAEDTLDNLLNSPAQRARMLEFLDNIPDGSFVLLVNMNRMRWAAPLMAPIRQKLATVLGSQLVGTLRNGDPWAIVAEKRAGGGRVLSEKGADPTLTTATYNQLVELSYTLSLAGREGQITSTLIGPARQWQSLYHQVRPGSATSAYTLSLVGVSATSQEKVLLADIKDRSVSLAGYSASDYPYLKLKLTTSDTTNYTPAQLRQWLLSYQGLPEGTVRRDLVADAAYAPALFTRQAVDSGYVKFPVKFENLAPDPFSQRLQVQLSLYDASGNLLKYPGGAPVQKLVTAKRDLVGADSVLTFTAAQLRLNVIGLFGTFTPVAVVNPQLQPEQYYFNNELRLPPFTVTDTNVPPTLDVAVDGRHILNGEIVSPSPVVSIQLRDEDRLRPLTDQSALKVFLQRAGEPTATLVNDPNLLRFTVEPNPQGGSVAKLEYTPGKVAPLANGVYTLQVQGTDRSGATSGAQTYQVKFEVVRESTITNVFPYPNPVTSKARFVFTLTGAEMPRNMKIQIMTLTGKVVREIFMNELGALHIGNNITDYAWDGTDQYGDRLANGTYLYRVIMDDDGKFSRRATAADQAFRNDWGKLVLLR